MMESTAADDIFADLLSGLQPSSSRQEPVREDFVSMEENRRKAMSDGEADPLPVRRSDTPVGDNLRPPPPPLTKADIQEIVHESLRELLFQKLGALTSSLREVLNRNAKTTAAVQETCREINAGVQGLTETRQREVESFDERCRAIEQTLKETTVGVQRMLEKQDLLDAHVLLNRRPQEEAPPPKVDTPEEPKIVKSEKRVSVNKGPVIEEVEDSDEEEEIDEEDPPSPVVIAKKSKPRPVTYLTEAEGSRRPVEHTTYVQRDPQKTEVLPPPPALQQHMTPYEGPRPPLQPGPYTASQPPVDNRPPYTGPASQPPVDNRPPYTGPGSQPSVENRSIYTGPGSQPPVENRSIYTGPGSQPPVENRPPYTGPGSQPPVETRPPYPVPGSQPPVDKRPPYPVTGSQPNNAPPYPVTGSQPSNTPPQPQQGYPPAAMADPYKAGPYQYPPGENGYSGQAPQSGGDKPVSFLQPPSQFGAAPGPTASQLPPPPQQPPSQYPSYPTLPPQQVYRSQQQPFYGRVSGNLTEPKPAPPPPQQQKTSDASPGHASTQKVPLDQVITDVANMGFDRTKVRSVVTNMLDRGENVDLNVVIDRLMSMYH